MSKHTGSDGSSAAARSLEKQFGEFKTQLEESESEFEASFRRSSPPQGSCYASILLVHHSRPTPELLEKAKSQVDVLKEHYKQLAEILEECPGQYYRYHGDWRSETQSVVSMLTFMHWLETGRLLEHKEAEEKLGIKALRSYSRLHLLLFCCLRISSHSFLQG